MSKTAQELISSNSEKNLINKEVYLVLMMQLMSPVDKIYKLLRHFISMDTKGIIDLKPAQKKMIYHSIIFSKCIFTMFSSQNDVDKLAQKSDNLVPPINPTERYNFLVSLNESFVLEIMSIPRAGQFMYIMLKKKGFDNIDDQNEAKCYKEMLGQIDDLNFKNLFNSFYFSLLSRKTDNMEVEEEKIETSSEISGTLLPENQRSEKKMFIFTNVFALLHKYFLVENTIGLDLALCVLDKTVSHLPSKLFSDDENYLETNFNMYILKNQLNYIVDKNTVKNLFSLVLSNENGDTNPQSVVSLCKIYSVLMMLSQGANNYLLNEKNLNF